MAIGPSFLLSNEGREVVSALHAVVGGRYGHELAGLVVDDVLRQLLADACAIRPWIRFSAGSGLIIWPTSSAAA